MKRKELYDLLCGKIKEGIDMGKTYLGLFESIIINTLERNFKGAWWQITDCDIPRHLNYYKDPYRTALRVVKKMKDGMCDD